MMNKTKNTEGLRRNPSAAASRRPKRCHLCKKTFAFDKYVSYRKDRKNTFRSVTASKTRRLKKAKPKTTTSQCKTKTKAQWPLPSIRNLSLLKSKRL